MNKLEIEAPAGSVENDWGSRNHVRTLVLMAVTAIGIYLCYRLVLPFLAAVVWALALAVVFSPFHRRVESKVKRPTLAALICVLLIGAGILGLMTFVGERLVHEAAKGADLIKTKVEAGAWGQVIDAHPRLAPLARKIERQIDLPGTVQTIAAWVTDIATSIVKGSVVQVLGFLLTFYLLFFFLRDRREVLQSLRSLLPLTDAETDRLFGRVDDTIYATVYGTLTVSAVQGLLGGLMFWWLGLPAPLLWGVVMALLSVMPVLGAFVVWIPASIFLAVEGHWVKGLIMAGWGGLVVATVDNLLRPILVGNRLRLHTVLAFISVIGGLILFGSAGLILGPVALTVTVVLLDVWRGRTMDTPVARKDESKGFRP